MRRRKRQARRKRPPRRLRVDDLLDGNADPNDIIGGPGNDSASGSGGNDVLQGGIGSDSLDGGPGQDRLLGGPQADFFLFRIGEANGDTVIDNVNADRAAHIVTLEDPIEVLHEDKQSLVSQREIGADTDTLLSGIRRAGRQNADVIFVDEPDQIINPLGAKGLGEIGIVGVGAAIANAVYHATGKRVRDLPITLDKLL